MFRRGWETGLLGPTLLRCFLWDVLFFIILADTPAWPASALDRWPGVFPNGVFIHLYLSEQHSCWTRVKIEYSPISNFSQNLNVPINPSSKCLFYKFSRNMWTHKDSFQPNWTPVSAHAVIHRWRQGLTKHENAANLTEAEDCSGLGILGFHATTGVKK